jgi:hypothetical protein
MISILAIIGSTTFFIAIVIYILLFLGYPLGELAMGGKSKIIPKQQRPMIAFSIIIQVFAVIILLQTAGLLNLWFNFKITRIICIVFSIYLTINIIMNSLSKSKKEKFYMTPISVVVAICFWLVAFL